MAGGSAGGAGGRDGARLLSEVDFATGIGFRESIPTDGCARAGRDLLKAMRAAYDENGGCHYETLMAALAAMAGEWSLRAGADALRTSLPAPPAFVPEGIADPYLYGDQAPGRMSILALMLPVAERDGVPGSLRPDTNAIIARACDAIRDGQPYPPRPEVPERNLSREPALASAARHRQLLLVTMARHDLSAPDEIAYAIGHAMAGVFRLAEITLAGETLSARTLLQLATETMIHVSRLAPVSAEAA